MKQILFNSFDMELFNAMISNAYYENDRVRFIFDFSGKDFTILDLIKAKPILEKYREQTKTKLESTIIIAPHRWQRIIIRLFLTILKPERPYEIYRTITNTPS